MLEELRTKAISFNDMLTTFLGLERGSFIVYAGFRIS